jgi:hypothetical protein
VLADFTLSTAQVEEHQTTQPSLTIQLAAKAYFIVLSQHLLRDTDEIHGKHYTKLLKTHVYKS